MTAAHEVVGICFTRRSGNSPAPYIVRPAVALLQARSRITPRVLRVAEKVICHQRLRLLLGGVGELCSSLPKHSIYIIPTQSKPASWWLFFLKDH